MTDKETVDFVYWERNVLALRYADGWYNDDILQEPERQEGWTYSADMMVCRPRYQGWRRVLTLDGGKITFHIPDDFDVGTLPQVEPNWDGHTTEEKWRRILEVRGVKP